MEQISNWVLCHLERAPPEHCHELMRGRSVRLASCRTGCFSKAGLSGALYSLAELNRYNSIKIARVNLFDLQIRLITG
jgi:hypothetical protein